MRTVLQKQELKRNEAKIGHQKVVERLHQNLKKATVILAIDVSDLFIGNES
jgi:hypothetical protein